MTLHIFRAKSQSQPATRYRIELDTTSFTVRSRRRTQLFANCCKKRRYACNLFAHVYYDGTWFYCRPGKGCKA